ncbi:MAG: hypothetical protein ACK5LC_14945 [Coprobacillaceae bacterium]
MEKKEQQLRIAAILKDIGLDYDLIETMTSLTKEEINNVNT